MNDGNPTGEVRPMIDREPLERCRNAGRKRRKAVLRNLGGCVPALAALPGALERRIVGLRKPASGEFRLLCLEKEPGGA